MTFSYLYAMLPLGGAVRHQEEQTEALATLFRILQHRAAAGTVIVGMTAGLEEAKANGEDIDGEMISWHSRRSDDRWPGIGDSLLVGTLIPILLGVALGLSSGGSWRDLYIIAYNVILTLGMRLLYFRAELGKAVEMIVDEKRTPSASIIMLGTVVIGAVAARLDFDYNAALSCPVTYRLKGCAGYHIPQDAAAGYRYALLLV